MEDPDSDSLPTAMEVPTSALPPQEAIPSRVMVIGEGEIQCLRKHLKELSTSTGNLEKQLEGLCSPLVELSEKEDLSITARCWMKQVRELCHDTSDYLHNFVNSSMEFNILDARARNASERLDSYGLRPKTPPMTMVRRLPAPHAGLIHHVHNDMVEEVERLMGTDEELKVVSIVGPEGVGKTTLAKQLYRRCIGSSSSGELHSWAFLRVSAKPDIPRLLTSMYTQILRKQPSRRLNAHDLIKFVARYLQNKRYVIIIDDLWTADVWDIISRAFPDGDCCSRIITTTQFLDVAMTCFGHRSKYLFKMLPLSDVQSRRLFFQIVFGSESDYPRDLTEVSDEIIRKCGGLPLATINIASMLPSSTENLQEWTGIRDSLPSSWSANLSSKWMKEVVNLMFSTLRPHLKTSLLYITMYPVGWIVRKDDLVKQWVVEGFLDGVRGQGTEDIAGGYFDELVRRGMIQPVDTDKNGQVLSCTLHHTIHEVIVNKSMEENFVIVVDYFQSSIALPDKVRRLSVQFGGAQSAYIPESIMVSEVRSLAFFGFLQCLPSITQNSLLRVLILHIWADQDKDRIDLAGICGLHMLKYLKITCNITVKLPDKIPGLQYLETLEVSTLASIPWDIGGLSKLRILKIAVTKLSKKDIYSLKILPALSTLSVQVKTPPSRLFFFGKGGFSVLKFFTFWCSEPRLVIKENAMPKIEKVHLCFKAHEARQDGKKPITIRHLPSLHQISAKIWGTAVDAGSALADAVTNHPRNPTPTVQLMESREEKQHGTLEEQDGIMEEDPHEDSRVHMEPEPEPSRLPVPAPRREDGLEMSSIPSEPESTDGHSGQVVERWSNRLEESRSKVQLEQVQVCAEIGIECINSNPENRPDTQHIICRLDETESMDRYIKTSVRQNIPYDLLFGTMHALSLSYQQLHPNIRRCIEFCSMFPIGTELRKYDLVRLWIAQEFVISTDCATVEDIAGGYIQELVSGSFLQPSGPGSDCYIIHEVLHDILYKVPGNCFRIENASSHGGEGWKGDVPPDIQHIFILNYDGDLISEKVLGLENLRTLIVYVVGKAIEKKVIDSICKRLPKLRVLAIAFCDKYSALIEESFSVPKSIGQLKYLGYLAFRSNFFCKITLPSTLNNLQHIQLLDFGDGYISEFTFAELVNLRHIFCGDYVKLPYVGRLSSLQTLQGFTVSNEDGCELNQLRDLNKLGGQLSIYGLENVKSKGQALEANLAAKERITELTLMWESDRDRRRSPEVDADVFEGLCPPSGLKKLRLMSFVGWRYPDWMVGKHNGSPKYLQELELYGCSVPVPALGLAEALPQLCVLSLRCCDWDALPGNMEHLTSLKELYIHSCNKIRSLPSLPLSLKEFTFMSCNDEFIRSCQTVGYPNWQKIEHIPYKNIG